MLQLCKNEKEKVYDAICAGRIDDAEISLPNLIDEIILTMHKHGILQLLTPAFQDKRADNHHFPLDILLCLSIAAKLKIKTSLTDIPFAVTDAGLLAELGWNIWDQDRELEDGLFSESVMRKLVAKYNSGEWVSFYNRYVQEYLIKELGIQPCIHILDCTKVQVNLKNPNYEGASVVKIDGETMRGYKLGVLRGVLDDSGIAEEVVFGTLKTHDLELCREMLKNTACFQEHDILINDRGFLSREMINYLKTVRKVDSYLPVRENMDIYQEAVKLAVAQGKWHKHPNRKRPAQRIQLVTGLGPLWQSSSPKEDVPVNTCVVHDTKTGAYFVFVTTDTSKTARQILSTYELRPEIEEDFRQMKDFWKLEDFKSTKLNYIAFHIIMTLIGYLYFQVYKNLEEGRGCAGKSLPVLVKKDTPVKSTSIIIYAGQYYGIFSFLELVQVYTGCTPEVQQFLNPILAKI